MRRFRPLSLVFLLAALFATGAALRRSYGLEFDQESIHGLIAELGWAAPAIFVALVAFRTFVMLPSAVVLSVGGVLFGTLRGTLLGAAGIVVSALFMYVVARAMSRDWLRPRFGAVIEGLEQRAEAVGPMLVGLATAYPTGPMSPLHIGAGFASVPALSFLLAVAVSAPVRAFAYSFFGASLLEPGTPRFFVAVGILTVVALLPFLHARTRKRMLAAVSARAADASPETG